MTRTSVRYDDGALSPAQRNDRRRSIDDLTHKGHTPREIAETLDYTTQTITGEISRIRKRSRDLFAANAPPNAPRPTQTAAASSSGSGK